MSENKLKRCPFCDSEVQLYKGFIAGVTMIVCPNCRATVSFGGKEKENETVKAWNRRPKK